MLDALPAVGPPSVPLAASGSRGTGREAPGGGESEGSVSRRKPDAIRRPTVLLPLRERQGTRSPAVSRLELVALRSPLAGALGRGCKGRPRRGWSRSRGAAAAGGRGGAVERHAPVRVRAGQPHGPPPPPAGRPRLLHIVAPMVDSVSVVAASRVTREGYEVSTRGPDGSWLCGAGRSGTTCGAACPSTA